MSRCKVDPEIKKQNRRVYMKKYRLRNLNIFNLWVSKQSPEWHAKRRETQKQYARKQYEINPQWQAERKRLWREKNRAHSNSYLLAQKYRKVRPAWADKAQIQLIYCKAREWGFEVDHIIPVTHPLVCGLHTPDNLQLLARRENAQKNNHFSLGD